MEAEVSQSIRITINLLIISIILSVITLTTYVSMQFQRDVMTQLTNAETQNYASELISATSYNKPIPAPTAYLILSNNEAIITSISGNVYGINISTPDDLKSIFDKKVFINSTMSNGRYSVVITES